MKTPYNNALAADRKKPRPLKSAVGPENQFKGMTVIKEKYINEY